MCALTIGVPGLWCYSYSGTVWKRCQYKLDPGLWFYRKVSFGMVVAWDTINFHSLLNQVQLNENKHQNLENNCHFGTLFWHRDCWSKTSRWNRKISHWSLFGGPSNMSYQLSISECCCASLYGKLYIKMLEASNDPILEFSAAGGYTFNFKERERARERERFGPYWRRLHAPSTPNDFWTICGKATWTRAVLKQKLSVKSTN